MIDIAFIFFRTLRLEHLDAAWYSLSRQDFTGVQSVQFLDNNTEYTEAEIEAVLVRYPLPVPLVIHYAKHGDPTKTQSWSCNKAVSLCSADWVFLMRADFLIDDDCLARFVESRDLFSMMSGDRSFVTSWCQQMGYDDALSNTDALAAYTLPDAPWRTDPKGLKGLVGTVPSHMFQSTDKDAGVWLIKRELVSEVGGLNERMSSWGYQQQVFQRALMRAGVQIIVIPDYLFHHQHHYAVRDFEQAARELQYE